MYAGTRRAASRAAPLPPGRVGHHYATSRAARPDVPRHDGGLTHAGAGQHRCDFAGLHAEAADFHLVVEAPEHFQLAVPALAHQVAGAIGPAALAAPALGDELLGRRSGRWR